MSKNIEFKSEELKKITDGLCQIQNMAFYGYNDNKDNQQQIDMKARELIEFINSKVIVDGAEESEIKTDDSKEVNKTYMFDYKKFQEAYFEIFPISIHDEWALKCDGKLITKVLSENEGEIDIDGEIFSIDLNWCKEIIDVKYLSVDR